MKNKILSWTTLRICYDIHMKDKQLFLRSNTNCLIAHVEMSKNKLFILTIKHDVAQCFKNLCERFLMTWTFEL